MMGWWDSRQVNNWS